MKFDVKYFITSSPNKINKNTTIGLLPRTFQGEGSVFVNDNALIFQGNMSKFNIGGSLSLIVYKQILCVSTTRTVLYACITKYKQHSAFRKAHEITYQLPNSEKVRVKFHMTQSKKRHDEMFTSQLKEYLAVAQSFAIS